MTENERKNVPSGRDILATLITLLADQENVNITYEFKESSNEL